MDDVILAAAALALYAWVPGAERGCYQFIIKTPGHQYSSTLQVPELFDYTKAGDVKRFALTAETGQLRICTRWASDTYGLQWINPRPDHPRSEGDNVDIAVTNS